MTPGGVSDSVDVLQELPLDKNLVCLVVAGKRVQLELWVKTRRRKSPYDRCVVATMDGPDGNLSLCGTINTRAVPFRERLQKILSQFEAMAVVEVVDRT